MEETRRGRFTTRRRVHLAHWQRWLSDNPNAKPSERARVERIVNTYRAALERDTR